MLILNKTVSNWFSRDKAAMSEINNILEKINSKLEEMISKLENIIIIVSKDKHCEKGEFLKWEIKKENFKNDKSHQWDVGKHQTVW